MAMRCFNFAISADSLYHPLWTLLQGVTGFFSPGVLVPDRCCQLILSSDSGALVVSDGNNANVAGMPLASGSKLTFQSATNAISLRDIYLKGSGLAVSGWIVFQ